jgi:hypothetical protein
VLKLLDASFHSRFSVKVQYDPPEEGTLTGPETFDLLASYCYEAAGKLTFHTAWAFVNVAFQLLHPLLRRGAATFLHDVTQDGDIASEQIAAEVLGFALRTAKELTMRQDVPISVDASATAQVVNGLLVARVLPPF